MASNEASGYGGSRRIWRKWRQTAEIWRKSGGDLAEIWRESAEAAIGVRQEDSRRDPVLLM